MNYSQVLADWKYLFETISAAYDMTGGYVDQDDLDKMLKSPKKSTATSCMVSQMEYWFQVGPDVAELMAPCLEERDRLIAEDPRVLKIKERYNF